MKDNVPISYRILSLEAKDLVETLEQGFNIELIKNNRLNKKFKSVFSDCMDLRYLQSFHKIKYDKSVLIPYMTEIINVKFDYRNTKYNLAQLREILYEKGFTCNGEKYVRYKRSSGSSRKGKCLFIREDLCKKMEKWSNCGLNPKQKEIQEDLVSFEAYRALSLSGIENLIHIPLNSILFVFDKEAIVKDDVVSVSVENGLMTSKRKTCEISNSIFDGEGLLDESVFEENGYQDKGMLLLRNRFFKSCVFHTRLQKWFKDNNIQYINQLNGYTLANDVSQIKMVVADSSLKYLKFGKDLNAMIRQWIDNADPEFGVVKTDKKTHFFQGRMVQTSYQLINTLNLSPKDIKKFLQPSFDYRNQVRNIPEVMQHHLFHMSSHDKEKRNQVQHIDYKTSVILKLMQRNKEFYKTSLYKEFRTNVTTSLRNRIAQGKVLIPGTYATLFGNPYEFLQFIINPNEEFKHPILEKDCIMSTLFQNGEEILCARSPHITMGNLFLAKNVVHPKILEYFHLTPEIVIVDAIKNNIQHRLNGCDYDSDTMLLTNHTLLIDRAREHYHDFKVPYCDAKVTKVGLTSLSKIDSDVSNNVIGNIVNMSQRLNSRLWDKYHKDGVIDYELYDVICQLAVLSGMEIDKAKRYYGVKSSKVLEKIRTELNVKESPYFLFVCNNSSYKEQKQDDPNLEEILQENQKKKDRITYFDTPMDYLEKEVEEDTLVQEERQKAISFLALIKPIKGSGGFHSIQRDKIIQILEKLSSAVKHYRADYSSKDIDEEGEMIIQENVSCEIEATKANLRNLLKDAYTIYLTLSKLWKDKKKDLYFYFLYFLLEDKNQTFLSMYPKSEEKTKLVEDEKNGNIQLYDFWYFVDKN